MMPPPRVHRHSYFCMPATNARWSVAERGPRDEIRHWKDCFDAFDRLLSRNGKDSCGSNPGVAAVANCSHRESCPIADFAAATGHEQKLNWTVEPSPLSRV